MKKIYSFIALFLMCFVSVQAQHQWKEVGENLNEGELVAGEGNNYVIIEGDNTSINAETGEEQAGTHSQGGFLSNNGCVAELSHDCVFNFIETGEEKEGFKIYVLRNVANGQYLVANSEYTTSKAKAFQFTVRKAKAVTEEGHEAAYPEWIDYSNIVSASRSMHAEEYGAWVFCKPDARSYMCFWGKEPNISGYIDTNNWFIKKVEEETMTAHAKLVAVYSQYFAEGVSEDIYPVGENPGCVSQEFYNKLESIFKEAETATANPDTDPAECDRIREAIINVFAEMETAVVPVGPGYFLVENVRGGFLKDNNRGFADHNLTLPVEAWDLNNAKYIWKIENAEEEGRLLFKNFATNRYLGKGSDYKMVDEPNGSFTAPNHQGTIFLLHDGKNHANIGHNGNMTDWNDANDPGNHFKFYIVESVVIDSLTAKVEQNVKNSKLADLVEQAERDLAGLKYKNGFIEDGFYNHPSDTGLVRDLLGANANDPSEGSVAEMFDGKLNTYYHTSWHASVAPAGNHWVSVDLGKEVSELIIKFTQRHNAHNGDPVQFKLFGPEEGGVQSEEWPVELASSADSIEYQYASATGDSTTFIGKYKLNVPSQYVRFVVTATKGNQFPAGEGSGPCWHVSELRFYDAADCVDNPNFVLVPEATRTALANAIDAAKEELEAKAATDATYETLDKALEAFWEAYPDATSLKDALESAKGMVANAKEADNQMGFYQTGAAAALKTVVDEIEAEIKKIEDAGNALSLEQIKTFEAQLDKAIAEFNSKLVVPEGGKVYRIVCTAGNVLNEDGTEKEDENGDVVEQAQNDACIASADADFYHGTPVWGYKASDADDRFNTLWLVEKSEAGFSFKNLANGLYMNNPYEGLSEDSIKNADIPGRLGYSKEAKHFQLEGFTAANQAVEGSFLISMYKNQFVNLDPQGVVVHWADRNDSHAAFTFNVVEEGDFSETYKVDVEPGKIQIVSLPIEISEVSLVGNEGKSFAYEVAGAKDNKLYLNPISDVIPAGTAFIVSTKPVEVGVDEGEKTIDAILVNTSLKENLNLDYNYEPVVKNGLVSAPFGFDVEEGVAYGVIIGKNVVATEAGDHINAGSGFFNNSLPEATDGEFFLEIEGKISGEGTAVENVEIVKNVASDVYTVAGVKVRQNVKAASATKNLPKGVYIVGGKKVIVK